MEVAQRRKAATPSKAAPKILIFSRLAVEGAPVLLVGGEAVPGPSAEGLDAGV